MQFLGKSLAAGLVMAAASFGVAHAGVYTINVWSGAPDGVNSSLNAALPAPTGSQVASFTYTGDINFNINSTNNALNTMSNFFGSAGGSITNYTSQNSTSFANFGNLTMSSGGSSLATYIQVLGSYTGATGTIGSISHDDGASLYDLTNGITDYYSPAETNEITQTFALTGVGQTRFDLVYVEANGDPSNLVFAVPEPASIALLGIGLLGLGIAGRRRSSPNRTA